MKYYFIKFIHAWTKEKLFRMDKLKELIEKNSFYYSIKYESKDKLYFLVIGFL